MNLNAGPRQPAITSSVEIDRTPRLDLLDTLSRGVIPEQPIGPLLTHPASIDRYCNLVG